MRKFFVAALLFSLPFSISASAQTEIDKNCFLADFLENKTSFYITKCPTPKEQDCDISYDYLGEYKGSKLYQTFQSGLCYSGNPSGKGASSLYSLKLNGDIASIKEIAGGNMCEGAVTDAAISNGTLKYSYSLTPTMFVKLFSSQYPTKTYANLPYQDHDCYFTYVYDETRDINPTATPQVVLRLEKDALDLFEGDDRFPCFQKLFKSELKNSEGFLTWEEAQKFANQIKTCD